jgi:hypothetical protein
MLVSQYSKETFPANLLILGVGVLTAAVMSFVLF